MTLPGVKRTLMYLSEKVLLKNVFNELLWTAIPNSDRVDGTKVLLNLLNLWLHILIPAIKRNYIQEPHVYCSHAMNVQSKKAKTISIKTKKSYHAQKGIQDIHIRVLLISRYQTKQSSLCLLSFDWFIPTLSVEKCKIWLNIYTYSVMNHIKYFFFK